ncbi:type II secretion system protein [Candidatus Saccharibacteria bacterium]|nr:type II secretion system protein [Candidatus Saccharibacteria bacterium]
MKKKKGFTVPEISAVIVVALLLFVLFFTQYQNFAAMHRDEARKTAINTIYYALENKYKEIGYYPESISIANLPVVAEKFWTDPEGHDFNTPESSYIYQPANCHQARCTEYTLRTRLEKEDDYIKTNSQTK